MSGTDKAATAEPLGAALYWIFRALARLCLRHGLSYEAAAEIAKRAFVDVAHREFVIAGRKQSASRVALLTGLHRKEVGRMLDQDRPREREAERLVAYGERIVAGWRRDEEFTDRRGAPAALPFDGPRSFTALVKLYGGGDLPGRAVLDELIRVGAATRMRDGRIRLVARAYVPARASAESIAILGSDVSDLVSTIDHNLERGPEAGFFQRRVAYDNLPSEAVEEIHAKVRSDGQSLLERLDRVMSRRDRDANPRARGTGRKRAMVGIYFFVSDARPEEEEKP
jgi:uncharacterized protein DUF6502